MQLHEQIPITSIQIRNRTSSASQKSLHDPYQSLTPLPPREIIILTFITID